MIKRLQYITGDHPKYSHSELVEAACEQGVKWIQLRMKEAKDDEIIIQAQSISETCHKHGATFILNDRVDLVETVGADGVHVGLKDVSVSEARKRLGPNKIIGGTANTIDDVLKHVDQGADYVGVGPYRFTDTKKNLSPILGLNGYRQIKNYLDDHNINIPLVAIGGIGMQDFIRLNEIGVNKFAVSSLISALMESPEKIRLVVQMADQPEQKISYTKN